MIPETAIYNDAGQVIMRYMRQANSYVRCRASGNEYVFTCRANIAIAAIEPEDVDCMLGVMASCCGNKKKRVVFFADETHYRRWINGGGR